jgi:ATP-dependent helicase/nuclease subunit B
VQVRFLLGPAGSGKTFRVLADIRQSLMSGAQGPALVLLAPKQTTYQLERQLLADSSIPGYTRLQILSFERLAHFIFDQFDQSLPAMLNEEGRVMVLRGLLAGKRDQLKLFRASSRLTGFAQELSVVLSELQRSQQTPESLISLADQVRPADGLAGKLRDFALLLKEYLDWLKIHNLQDADSLLQSATRVLAESPVSLASKGNTPPFGALWVDGFGEWTSQEIDLMASLILHCERATFTFCLDKVPTEKISWLSVWAVVRRSYEELRKRLRRSAQIELSVEVLDRDPVRTRFANNPVLQHLEQFWPVPQPFTIAPEEVVSISDHSPVVIPAGQLEWSWAGESATVSGKGGKKVALQTASAGNNAERLPSSIRTLSAPSASEANAARQIPDTLRIAVCDDPDAEATLAAREILLHVRNGGRFRDVAVLVRDLPSYTLPLHRIFSRYEIPYFMDRRESVSHHPLAELTRSALRTLVFQWKHDDWFAVLKTGLVRVNDEDIDTLENESLARGWTGLAWRQPIRISEAGKTAAEERELRLFEQRLETLRLKIVPPFERLAASLDSRERKPNGAQLASTFRQLWKDLQVEQTLQEWAEQGVLGSAVARPDPVHATVWEQINVWLENLELGFPVETLTLRDWLPIVDAGLSTLTVGIIPPALDQVLVGAIDRSRNPEVKLGLVLGLNENVFPSSARPSALLTDGEREVLETQDISLGASARQRLGREHYLAYLACTRARERMVFTRALHNADGAPLHPSPFLSRIAQLFPTLEVENISRVLDWREAVHPAELVEPLLRSSSVDPLGGADSGKNGIWRALMEVPRLASILERLRDFQTTGPESLNAELAQQLYGPVLHTSVSRMERFGACPFQFFVHSGLRAKERKLFEFDSKEQGSFQHDVLARFHQQLQGENKRWRDISPKDARDLITRIAQPLTLGYRDGLMQTTEQTRFMARALTESLQDFAETIVGWMQQQYQFNPVHVELPFGADDQSPAWRISLKNGRELALYGRIDRIDLWPRDDGEGLCVVVDYKSSHKQLDAVLMAHGIQLQLLAYLNVLRNWPDPHRLFGVKTLIPAGVFYVNLKGKHPPARNRTDALNDPQGTRRMAYRHSGRFDVTALHQLDARPNATQGDQFNYRLKDNGEVHMNCLDPVPAIKFRSMLDSVEANLKQMSQKIYAGSIDVAPYQKGQLNACQQCDFRPICRLDPWTHQYRVLSRIDTPDADEDEFV